MTLEEVEKLMEESPTYKVEPGNYLMLYDINAFSKEWMQKVCQELMTQFGMKIMIIGGYDSQTGVSPIQLFKVK